MKNKKAISATIVLVLLWLLIGLSNISYAENIPISEEGLGKIGLNKFRLESGIGVLVFNLSEKHGYNRLTGNGYLTVSNTFNSSITISCSVITGLSTVDSNEDGTPRIHKIISNSIVFDSIPDGSWVTLEEDKATVEPYCIYNFRYAIDMPLNDRTVPNRNEGYLVYINIKKDMGSVTGANVGIDYNYKLFLIFSGELEQGIAFSGWMLIPIPIVSGGVLFAVYKKKHKTIKKKTKITPDPKPLSNTDTVFAKRTFENKSSTDDAMRQRIDSILKRDSPGKPESWRRGK